MIFLHGGVLCPAELAALAATMPFALALFHWLRCYVATWWKGRPLKGLVARVRSR